MSDPPGSEEVVQVAPPLLTVTALQIEVPVADPTLKLIVPCAGGSELNRPWRVAVKVTEVLTVDELG